MRYSVIINIRCGPRSDSAAGWREGGRVKYREAEWQDLPRLQELEQRVIDAERPFNVSIRAGKTTYYDIEHLITDDDSFLLVAEEAGKIIGTGYAQIRQSKTSLEHRHHSYLGFMYVSPDFRRRGINTRILEALVDWSRQHGCSNIYLEVYARNAQAIGAYEKIGFEPCVVEMKLML